MKKLILVFALLTCLNKYSQCDEKYTINYTNGETGYYTGCLGDDGKPKGLGINITTSYKEEGLFDGANLNDPNGKRTLQDGKLIQKGNFENGSFTNGKETMIGEGFKVEYNGEFYRGKYDGEGFFEQIQPKYRLTKQGKFRSGSLFDGEEMTYSNGNIFTKIYIEGLIEGEKEEYKDGLEVIKTFRNGRLATEIRNDKNYYDADDIIGDDKRSVINLRKEGSENEGIKYKIEMSINGVSGEWLFDTGAEITSIGKRMFQRFMKEGVTYKDLNRVIKTFGVGGESKGKLIVLDNIKIGDYVLNNMIVEISLDNNFSLLGTDFLNKFTNVEWNMKKNELSLVK